MFENEISSTFETLLEDLDSIIEDLNQEGSRQFYGADHKKARLFLENSEAATLFRTQVKDLQEQWRVLESKIPAAGSGTNDLPPSDPSHMDPGLKRTPAEEFLIPVLQALVNLGGKADILDVMKEVERIMAPVLNDLDKLPQASSPRFPRWARSVEQARHKFVMVGWMARDTLVGIWQITDAGRQNLLSGQPVNIPVEYSWVKAMKKKKADPSVLPYIYQVVLFVTGKRFNYIGAVKQIQRDQGLRSAKPIFDACTTEIDLTSNEFEKYLQDLPGLVFYLVSIFPEHEQEIREKILS